ncbi:MAG TPA: nitroreductase/quinone reductase family protein [Solirubrobacteraceae bacterium]|jgi:deazaflavin-dependent oxidoreductase (nitroreductase family)
MAPFPKHLAGEAFAYLTTTGRRTGRAREIEIWFALDDGGATVHVMSGAPSRAGWVHNLRADPAATVRVAGERRDVRAEGLGDGGEEDARARDLLVAKYGRDGSLDGWRARGLPVALRVGP